MPDDKTVLDPDEFDREVDELFGQAKQHRKKKNAAIIVAGVAIAIATGAAATAIEGRSERKDLTRAVQINAEKVDAMRNQFEYCKTAPKNDPKCQQPVAVEPVKPTEKPVDKGLTENEVRDIVAAEVARRNLTLTPSQITTVANAAARMIPRPKDGKTPTTAELRPLVSTAVATFCANGACRGKDGADAPPVTSQQLANTLAAWCEPRNNCIGADGKNGANGNDGAGVKDVTTTEGPDGVKVTFTFTDGRDPVSFTVLNGKDGDAGPKGEPGYPFTFVFTVPNGAVPDGPGTTYSCTVTGPEKADTTCTKQ